MGKNIVHIDDPGSAPPSIPVQPMGEIVSLSIADSVGGPLSTPFPAQYIAEDTGSGAVDIASHELLSAPQQFAQRGDHAVVAVGRFRGGFGPPP